MPRRFLRYALDIVLLGAAVVAFLTGLLVDRLDLHQFAPHRWAGYVLAGLVAVHVAAHWRFFLAPFASRRRAPAPPRQGAAAGVSPAASEQVRSGPTRRAALAAAGAGAVGAAAGWFVKTGISPDPYGGGDAGLFYHQQSSLGPRGLLRSLAGWGSRPAPYKHVAGGAAVALPAARPLPELSVGRALHQRRSLRRYRDRMLTAQELAWLVHAATAITSGDGYRTAPSAGALYPIETYVAVSRVQGIDAGLYHVDVRAQALEPVRAGPVAGDLMIAGVGQEFLRQAPAVFVLTGVFQRARWKYRERHYRYVCWEGGHLAQNLYLAAEAAGLGACMVGAFLDRMLNDLLRIDGRHEAALGLVAVGPR
jgi:SagB-type dehydrogenase family enzyme